MKKIIENKIALALIIMLPLAGCQGLFNAQDIKTSPNAALSSDINLLISGTLVGTAMLHEDTDVRIASLWAGELAGLSRQHQGFAQYIVNSGTFSWSPLYPTAANARLIQTNSIAAARKWSLGVGEILEVMLIAKATDLYGDVPYSQAFDIDKYPTPVYDKQADIYTALLAKISDAITNLSAPADVSFADGDFIYNGDPKKWTALAYSIQARLYLHLQQYPAAVTASQSGIASVAGDALVPHGTGQGVDDNQDYDFFAITRTGDTGFADDLSHLNIAGVKAGVTAYLPVLMLTRMAGDPSNTGNTKTDETAMYNYFFEVGYSASNSLDPNLDAGAFQENAPFPLFTYYETMLIQAEALAREGGLDDVALTALNNVRSALNTGGVVNGQTIATAGRLYAPYVIADFGPGGVANPSNLPEQQALILEIITEKYILELMQYESFNDVRRLAVATPTVQLPIPLVNGTQKPERFIYPQTELQANPNTPNPLPSQFTRVAIW